LTQALPDFERRYERNEAIARAYLSGQHTMAAIAQYFGVHHTTVSGLVSAHEESVG
jgi:transposase-like protein